MKFLWFMAAAGAVIGAFLILVGITQNAAPAQAAIFAGACAFAIVPYVFARAAEMLSTVTALTQLTRIANVIDKDGTAERAAEKSAIKTIEL